MKEAEKRFHPEAAELRFTETTSETSVGTISGYAAVFNALSEDFGRFRERIAKGAFAESIKKDVRALWSHDSGQILGRTSNNTLTLREDDHGLKFELQLPNTQIGRDALTSIKRKDVTGMSFGFFTQEDSWTRGKPGEPHIRTLLKVDLFEVSPVAFPAYPATQVSLRGQYDKTLEELEQKWAKEEKQPKYRLEDIRPKVNRLFLGAQFNL